MNGAESARLKVTRARTHLQGLEICAAGYTGDESNFVVDKSEGKQRLRFPNAPHPDIAILAGEVIYQLRSALDHLAFELTLPSESVSLNRPVFED